MTDQPFDPPADHLVDPAQPTDRDERRVQALQRFMRKAIEQERRVGLAAVRKITSVFRDDTPEE